MGWRRGERYLRLSVEGGGNSLWDTHCWSNYNVVFSFILRVRVGMSSLLLEIVLPGPPPRFCLGPRGRTCTYYVLYAHITPAAPALAVARSAPFERLVVRGESDHRSRRYVIYLWSPRAAGAVPPSVLARNEFGTTRSDAAVLPVQLQLAGCVLFSIANLAVARAYMDHRGRAREGTRVSGLYEAYVDTFPCFYAVPILVVRRRSKAPQRTLPL